MSRKCFKDLFGTLIDLREETEFALILQDEPGYAAFSPGQYLVPTPPRQRWVVEQSESEDEDSDTECGSWEDEEDDEGAEQSGEECTDLDDGEESEPGMSSDETAVSEHGSMILSSDEESDYENDLNHLLSAIDIPEEDPVGEQVPLPASTLTPQSARVPFRELRDRENIPDPDWPARMGRENIMRHDIRIYRTYGTSTHSWLFDGDGLELEDRDGW